MRDILVVSIVLVSMVVAFRRPHHGMLIFIAFGILNPHSFTWGFARDFPLAQLVAIATIAGYALSREPKKLPFQREVWLLLGLWVLFCVSTAFAYIPYRDWVSDSALTRFTYVTKILLMVFLSMAILNTKERVQMIMKVLALSIGFFAVKSGFWSIATGFTDIVWGPDRTFLSANNSIGLALAMNVPFLFYLIKVESNPWMRRLMWVMLGFSFPAVIGTFSRGAWLGIAAAVGLILFRSRYKVLIALGALIFTLVFLPLLTIDVLPERVQQRFDALVNYEEDASAVSRFWNWELCWRVGLANPLTGEGFNYYRLEIYPQYFPEFIEKYGNRKAWSCHSMWFTIWGEHGIVAFLVWIGLLVSSFVSLNTIARFSRRNKDLEWMMYYAWMLQISFVVYMIVGTFLDTAYFDVFYQLVAVVVLLKEHMHRVVRSWHMEGASQISSRPYSRRRAFVPVG